MERKCSCGMFHYTVSTQMHMTITTVHRCHGIPSQGTLHNVLGAISGVHGHDSSHTRAAVILNINVLVIYGHKNIYLNSINIIDK